jgi:itaconate CoA-transferase
LIQCETGLLSVTGSPEEPAKAGISIADIAAGMYAYTAILTALYERERTGEGTHADVAMIDALGEWMSQPYLYARYGGQPPPRSGPRHASIAPYGPYQVKDAATVFIGEQNEREWRTLCQDVLADPALAEDPRFHTNSQRVRNNATLTELIETALAASSADEVTARLDRTGIANARLRDLHEFATHPQLQARDRWRPVQTPNGEALSLLPAAHVEGRECAMKPVPAPGQHTAALLREFAPVPAGAENTRRPDSRATSDRT